MTVSRFISLRYSRDIFYLREKVYYIYIYTYMYLPAEKSALGIMYSLMCLSHKYFSLTKESCPRAHR